MGKADFARLRKAAAAGHGDVGDGVVRVAEGAARDEAAVFAKLSGHGMYLGGFEAFAQRQGWQDGGQALGQHGLAAAGRTDEQHVVTSGGGHFEGPLHIFLSFDVGKVEVECVLLCIEFFTGVDNGGCQFLVAVKELDHFPQILHTVDGQVVYDGCFAGVLPGQNHAFEAQFACLDGDGQGTLDRLQTAV